MEPFNKDSMQNTLIRAGVTPRDLVKVMPCHSATLYAYLRTGRSKELNTFTFEKLHAFLEHGAAKGIFPLVEQRKPEAKQRYIQRAYNHWSMNSQSFDGFGKEENI